MRRWMVLAGLLAAAGLVLGRVVWRSVRGEEVETVRVARGRVVAAVYATGKVETDRRATVRARVAAPLERLLVGPGASVREGQEVGRQDDTALRIATERTTREAEAARAALAEADDAAWRAESLAGEGLLAEDAWVRAREQARQARAELAAREAALALAQEEEGWVVLRSPLSGVVSSLAHRAGDALREGDDVLTVVDLEPAYVRVAVDERDVGRVAPGQEVRMVFDAYPDRVLEGEVWRIVPAVDRLTKASDVLVRLPVERPPLQLDLTVTVNIVTGVVEDALVVPRDALEGSRERRVYVVGEGSRARAREVRLGPCDAQRCQVLEGLKEGEPVIAPLPSGLGDGSRVRVR